MYFSDKVIGTGDGGTQQNPVGVMNQYMPSDNMFLTSTEQDKAFEVFPEVSMKSNGIYKSAPKYTTGVYRFFPKTGNDLVQLLQTCRDLQQNPISKHFFRFSRKINYFSCNATTSKSVGPANRTRTLPR